MFASLGRGGMADVYLAVARGPMGFNKLTVIKRLRADLASEPSFLEMLLDEARLAARLSHPNVVHTYEVGEDHGTYFIAMEYLEGQALNRIVNAAHREHKELPAPLCARIVADALAGLHYAHDLRDYDGTPLRIVHRDISPHNLFVTYDGVVKLMDFGIAKAATSAGSTEIGVLKGKVAYMSPEQGMATEVDRRSDVFSMGIVLWELLAGQRLFSTASAAATLHKLLSEPIARLADVKPTVDPALAAIVMRALEKDPEKRFATALDFREALESFLAERRLAVRQEEIGKLVNELFEETRESVQRKIQEHMATVSSASSTGQVVALNRDAIQRVGSPTRTGSGRDLLQLAPDSQSGSGVLPTASPESSPGVPAARRKKKGGAMLFGGAVLLLLLGVLAVVAFRPAAPAPSAASATEHAPTSAPPELAPAPSSSAAPVSAAPSATAATAPAPSASGALVATPSASAATHHPRVAPPSPAAAATHAAPSGPPPSAPPAEVGTGYVTLDTYPWSRVSEDGRSLGVTPLVHLALPAGPHTLTFENADKGIKRTYEVTVKAGETVSRRLGLE